MELTQDQIIEAAKGWSKHSVDAEVIDALTAIVEQQQAEIERLRAELQQILGIAIGFHDSYKDLRATRDMAKIVSIIHGDTDEEAWQRADMAEWKAYSQQQPEPPQESLTPAELGEMAGKMEAVEEPLGIRVLQYLASSDEPKTAFEVQDELHTFVNFVMVAHLKDRLIYRNNGKYSITAAGRDYLASLDKSTIETTEDYLSQLD